ncbi:MAG: diacylglycerol kinase family protein [Candidatus Komeilibacteria bacterium]|nr:diacylglycerol kinase family protein [Candidatus Komeilibacteria bacterium]
MLSIKKLWHSLAHALRGLGAAWQTQNNFRWHSLALIIVIILGWLAALSVLEWILIIIVSGLVLITELINTMMERLVDLAKPRVHVYAQLIKDVMAGVTLLAALIAFIVGILIFLSHLL